MTKQQAIAMIDEYLLEPNNISKEWVECLRLCKEALLETMEADDRVKVVRCKDCFYRAKSSVGVFVCAYTGEYAPDDFYCSLGDNEVVDNG